MLRRCAYAGCKQAVELHCIRQQPDQINAFHRENFTGLLKTEFDFAAQYPFADQSAGVDFGFSITICF